VEETHVIIGADGKELRTSDLVELFDDDHCEGLKDKPKFFFIQVFSFYLKYIYSIAILVYRITITISKNLHSSSTKWLTIMTYIHPPVKQRCKIYVP
jgi:hypothetical protein